MAEHNILPLTCQKRDSKLSKVNPSLFSNKNRVNYVCIAKELGICRVPLLYVYYKSCIDCFNENISYFCNP